MKLVLIQNYNSLTGENVGEAVLTPTNNLKIPEGATVYKPADYLRLTRGQWQTVAFALLSTDNSGFADEVFGMLGGSSDEEFTVALPIGGGEFISSLIQQ